MNYKEILSKLDEYKMTPKVFGNDGDRYNTPEYQEYLKTAVDTYNSNNFWNYVQSIFGETEEVYQHGGEGQGDSYIQVYLFVEHNVHVRYDAFYSSYDGVDYDGCDWEFVIPKQRMVTFYERPSKDDLRDLHIDKVME